MGCIQRGDSEADAWTAYIASKCAYHRAAPAGGGSGVAAGSMRLSSAEREYEAGEHHHEKDDAEPVTGSMRVAFAPLALFVAVSIILPTPTHLCGLNQARVVIADA
jgi:hypothetical protein